MKRLFVPLLVVGLFLFGRQTLAAAPEVSASFDRTSYTVGQTPRLTVGVRTGAQAYSGVCVTYEASVNAQAFANNLGACGLKDLTDGSGSVTWLLPALASTGTVSVRVTTAAQAGIVDAGTGAASSQVAAAPTTTTTPTVPEATSTQQVAASDSSTVQIPNPIPCDDVNCVLTQVIKYILGGVALLATLMFVWGGVLLLTSGGNEKRITQGRETLAWAAIGIVVILLSWTIVKFVLTSVLTKPK